MRCRVYVEVTDRKEAAAIQRALEDAVCRATVITVGTLLPLTNAGQRRVLSFVADQLAEEHHG